MIPFLVVGEKKTEIEARYIGIFIGISFSEVNLYTYVYKRKNQVSFIRDIIIIHKSMMVKVTYTKYRGIGDCWETQHLHYISKLKF